MGEDIVLKMLLIWSGVIIVEGRVLVDICNGSVDGMRSYCCGVSP